MLRFHVTGMSCAVCQAHVQKAAAAVPGVDRTEVSLLLNTLEVELSPDSRRSECIAAVVQAVKAAGFGIEPAPAVRDAAKQAALEQADLDGLRRRFLLSLLFLVPLAYAAMHGMLHLPLPRILDTPWLQLALLLPILWLNRSFFIRGGRGLWRREPAMDSLVALGSGAGVLFSLWEMAAGGSAFYFDSAGMIPVLITFGKWLEARARRHTRDAVGKLIRLAPETAVRLGADGTQSEVPVAEVRCADVLIVRPGDAVPVDGVVVSGSSAVDCSAITGEPVPVEVTSGSKVTGGTVNCSGVLHIRATAVGEDTALARIIALVEEAGSSRAPVSRLADRACGIFVPAVICLALLTAAGWLLCGGGAANALAHAIAVLVISCPCALGLATPVAIMAGTGRAARMGILFKNAAALERLSSVNVFVLDKTGTVTCGHPEVVGAELLHPQAAALAAALERDCAHPLSQAVVRYAAAYAAEGTAASSCPAAEEVHVIAGAGVRGVIGSVQYAIGNARSAQEHGVSVDESRIPPGTAALYLTAPGQLLGTFYLADSPRPESRSAVEQLNAHHLRTVLLSGDAAGSVAATAGKCGITEWHAGLLPQEKVEKLRALRAAGQTVAMVGDGVNDAPSLAAADVGIAIGAGTDIAIEAADVVLTRSRLTDVTAAWRLSGAVMRNIRQNLFWAFAYNALCIPLAAGLFVPVTGWEIRPVFAAAAMCCSSLCVVGNALRLRRFT